MSGVTVEKVAREHDVDCWSFERSPDKTKLHRGIQFFVSKRVLQRLEDEFGPQGYVNNSPSRCGWGLDYVRGEGTEYWNCQHAAINFAGAFD
ncbi:hypothetical protein RvY_17998 [Ramazzottius varieornatus]|uniref:Uncharacterized protein n=1 Tax=Ramazzottius varieornatus TaxID=947166 RepID=A0A1D1W468_RAMVA|nr:hypothetical protein RvY_17998 [Ramazzottius varieornatus]